MTKAQNATFDVIENAIANGAKIISWDDIVTYVEATGFTVKNWMSVRNVLQVFIDEGQIIRTCSIKPLDPATLSVEEYAIIK